MVILQISHVNSTLTLTLANPNPRLNLRDETAG